MGLDIYAGTLSRYYSHNWKTVVQQWAEENGYGFSRVTPDGEAADEGEAPSPAEVQEAVENWRDQILAAIAQPGQEPYAPWPEDNERPYYTDKPDWDAFGAMLLVAACHTYDEPMPPTVEKNWDFGEHLLVARLASDEERVWSPCSAGRFCGFRCRTALRFRRPCQPAIPPSLARRAVCGRNLKS